MANSFTPVAVASSSTALDEAIAEGLVAKAILAPSGGDTLNLTSYEGSESIWIQDQLVSLPLSVNAQTSDTIDANGDTTGATPSASTSYWVYAQNGDLVALNDLALCATPPADFPYLAASGNGAKWRIVGSVKLDGSVLIAEEWHVGSYYHDDIDLSLANVFVSGASPTTNITAFTYSDIMLMPGIAMTIEFQCTLRKLGGSTNTLTVLKIFFDTVEKMGAVMYINDLYGDCNLGFRAESTQSYASFQSVDVELKMWYDKSCTTIDFPTNRNRVKISRRLL